MKIKKLFMTVGVIAFALSATAAFANYGEDNSLGGKVKEEGTSRKITKASVKLYNKNGSRKIDSDKTSKTGAYKFKDLSEGKYKVTASKDGYRNPKNAKKSKVSKIVKVDGSDKKNLYLEKE